MSDRVGMDRPGTWRLKGHAEGPFWRWVSSWARAIRKPSDYGYSDDHHHLPALVERTHVIEPGRPADGYLFDVPAYGLGEEREEQRRTIAERCEAAANALVDAESGWRGVTSTTNPRYSPKLIPGAVELTGSDPVPMRKRDKLSAFTRGEIQFPSRKPETRVTRIELATPHRMTYFPSHGYEQDVSGGAPRGDSVKPTRRSRFHHYPRRFPAYSAT